MIMPMMYCGALLFHPGRGTKYCDEYVCLSVCLSAHITRKPQSRTSQNFLCVLPMAVARSFSDSISGFLDDVMFSHSGPLMRRAYSSAARPYNSRNHRVYSDPHSAQRQRSAPEAKSGIYDCLVSEEVDELWVKAKQCGAVAAPPESPAVGRKHWDPSEMARAREQADECRRALREHDIPPYFDSDVYACFLSKQKQVRITYAVDRKKLAVVYCRL